MRSLRTMTARMSAVAGVLALATLYAVPAAAQQRSDTTRAPRTPNAGQRAVPGATRADRGPAARPARPGGFAGANIRADAGNPAAQLLRMRGPLKLTDDQVSRLQKLAETPRARTNPAEMLRARADLLEATQGNGDLASARAALDKMSRLRNEQTLANLKLRQDARAVLTADQQRTLDNVRDRAMRNRGGVRPQMRPQMRGQMRTPARVPMRGELQGGRMGPRMGPGMGQGMMGRRMGPGMGSGMAPRMMPQGAPAPGARGRGGEPPVPPEMLDVDSFENSASHIQPN